MDWRVNTDVVYVIVILVALLLLGWFAVAKRNTRVDKSGTTIVRVWTGNPDMRAYAVRGVSTAEEAVEAVGGDATAELIPTLDGVTTWLVKINSPMK